MMRTPRAFGAAPLAALALAAAASAVSIAGPAASAGRGLDIYWVDVEGGAATLIVTPAGESVLVDTGWPGERDAERIERTVRQAGLSRIDHLVTTHWHTDHFGGVEAVSARLPVRRYYDHGFPDGAPADIPAALQEAYRRVTAGRSTVLRPGDRISLRQAGKGPRVSAEVVTSHGRVKGEAAGAPQSRACPARPEHAARPDDPSDNARSVGVVLRFGAFEFLDLGDLTWNVEHKLVCPRNVIGEVDVYQVTHHGLDNSNHPAVLRAVAPTVAVVNNGPRKGGKPAVYQWLLAAPGPPEVFQVHRNVETSDRENAAPANVANDDEACGGRGIRLRVDPDARRYTVEVGGKGTSRAYAVR
jgi:competence protein ComEC